MALRFDLNLHSGPTLRPSIDPDQKLTHAGFHGPFQRESATFLDAEIRDRLSPAELSTLIARQSIEEARGLTFDQGWARQDGAVDRDPARPKVSAARPHKGGPSDVRLQPADSEVPPRRDR